MKKFLIASLLFLTFLSCEKRREVVFMEPQPNSSKDESTFRKNIQGKYLFPKDSLWVIIDDKSIVKVITCRWKFAKSDIDSSSHININDDRSILDGLRKEGMEGSILNDTVFVKLVLKDTLFQISEDNKLRTFIGYYFLNTKVDENAYEVLRMEVAKQRFLKFSKIDPCDSLDKYQSITPIQKIKDDSGSVVQYKMRPTKKELKKLIKEEAFIEDDKVYIKTEN